MKEGYRYGFNGKEKDNEIYGEGDSYDYGMRMYDPRLGRFMSVDPLDKTYPWYSPYQFAGNNPIKNLDIDGKEDLDYKKYQAALIDAGSKLSAGHNFPSGEKFSVHGESMFFTADGYGYTLKPGKKPAEGITDLIKNPGNYSMDCGTFVQVAKLAAMLNVMGESAFNDFYENRKDEKTGNYDFKVKDQQSSGIQFENLYVNVGQNVLLGTTMSS